MKEKSLSSLNGLGTLAVALLVALAGAALFVLGVAAKASVGSPNLLLMLLGALLVVWACSRWPACTPSSPTGRRC